MGQSGSKEGKKGKSRQSTVGVDAVAFGESENELSLHTNNNISIHSQAPARTTYSSFAGGEGESDLASSQYVTRDEGSLVFDREALGNKSVR